MALETEPLPITFRIIKGLGYAYLLWACLIAASGLALFFYSAYLNFSQDFPLPPEIQAEIGDAEVSIDPFFALVGVFLSALILGIFMGGPALLFWYAGQGLIHFRRYHLCLIASVLCLLTFPIGTVLGLLVLLLLPQGPVRERFRANDKHVTTANA